MAETADVTAPVLIAVTALPGAMFWRQNSGTFRTLDGLRVVKSTVVGIADIMGVYLGRAVAIETKARLGRMEKSQKLFRTAWVAAGGVYITARCPNDAILALAAINRP